MDRLQLYFYKFFFGIFVNFPQSMIESFMKNLINKNNTYMYEYIKLIIDNSINNEKKNVDLSKDNILYLIYYFWFDNLFMESNKDMNTIHHSNNLNNLLNILLEKLYKHVDFIEYIDFSYDKSKIYKTIFNENKIDNFAFLVENNQNHIKLFNFILNEIKDPYIKDLFIKNSEENFERKFKNPNHGFEFSEYIIRFIKKTKFKKEHPNEKFNAGENRLLIENYFIDNNLLENIEETIISIYEEEYVNNIKNKIDTSLRPKLIEEKYNKYEEESFKIDKNEEYIVE